MENRCVCCGSIIPEGRQICRECEGSELTKESFGVDSPATEWEDIFSKRINKGVIWRNSISH